MQKQKSSSSLRKTLFGKITGHFLDLEWQLPDRLLLKNPEIGALQTQLTHGYQSFTEKERGNAFQALENFLTELNLYNLKPKHRYLLLETARNLLNRWHFIVLQEAVTATAQSEPLLSEASSLLALETLLSQNYLGTLDAWTGQGVYLHRPSFVGCIHRVIDALSTARFWYTVLGRSPNLAFWKPVNTLYRFSEQHRLHKKICLDRARGWFYSTNIQKSFLKLCLFELSRPQKLSLDERIQLLDFLERKAGLARVKKYFSDDALFVIDLQEGDPPGYQAMHLVKPQGFWRAIDPTFLLTFLQKNSSQGEVFSRELVQKLTKYWAASGGKLPKIPSASHTKVILGLPNLYALTNSPKAAPPPSIQTCELTHVRPGSYCLCWHPGEKRQVPKRGDVMGIEYPLQNQSLYCVGVIKWLKRKAEEPYQMGIQVIAPTFLGVQLTLPSHKFCCQALLLPNLQGEKQPMTLITPKLTLPSGENITLRVENKNYFIQLTRLLHSTHQYHHYTFRINHEHPIEEFTLDWLKVT